MKPRKEMEVCSRSMYSGLFLAFLTLFIGTFFERGTFLFNTLSILALIGAITSLYYFLRIMFLAKRRREIIAKKIEKGMKK